MPGLWKVKIAVTSKTFMLL